MNPRTILYLPFAVGLLMVGHSVGLRGDAAPLERMAFPPNGRNIPHCARIDPRRSRLLSQQDWIFDGVYAANRESRSHSSEARLIAVSQIQVIAGLEPLWLMLCIARSNQQ